MESDNGKKIETAGELAVEVVTVTKVGPPERGFNRAMGRMVERGQKYDVAAELAAGLAATGEFEVVKY
jgi:hypothetical protein